MLVLSTGQIADEIGKEIGQTIDRDAVAYAIRKTGIKPVGRAGLVRLFSPDTVAVVRRFLDARRQSSGTQGAVCREGQP